MYRTYTEVFDKQAYDKAEYYYVANKQTYAWDLNNDDHDYQLHDSLIVKYSSVNPEIIKIQEIWRNGKLIKKFNDDI